MKKLYYLTLIIQACFLSTIDAQVYNDGGMITIQENALVHIQGDFTSQAGVINNDGLIEIGGNWDNATMDFPLIPGAGTVSFFGEDQSIGGMSPTLFFDLSLSDSTSLDLNSNIGVGNVIDIGDAIISLNGNQLHLLSPDENALLFENGGVIAETTETYSLVRWDIGQALSGEYRIPFINNNGASIPLSYSLNGNGIGETGFMLFSTYGTDENNEPLPEDVDNLMVSGQNDGLDMVDRFWLVEAQDFDSDPLGEVILSYSEVDEIGGNNGISQEELSLVYWNDVDTWEMSTDGITDMNTVVTQVDSTYGIYALWSEFTSSINDFEAFESVKVYPNPSYDQLNIDIQNASSEDIQMTVFNQLGQKIESSIIQYQGNVQTINLDTRNYQEGVYLVVLLGSQNRSSLSFIKAD